MLSGVTVSCFLLSYVVVFVVEASRFVLKIPGRTAFLVTMLVLGLFAHSVFLVNQFTGIDPEGTKIVANWFQWAVLGAWGLAMAYLMLAIRNPNGSMGLFFIPLILGLIGLGQLQRDSIPFKAETTISVWRVIHGVSLLLSTMVICFGVAFGAMYLVQSYRLKSRKKLNQRLKLPTLEFLQSMNRKSLFTTTVAVACGLLSGIILNVNRQGHLDWFSTGVVFTFALFVWSLTASVLELTTRGSLGGRRSAYLVIANFLFLLVVLTIVLISSHGQPADLNSMAEPTVRRLPVFSAEQNLGRANPRGVGFSVQVADILLHCRCQQLLKLEVGS